MVNIVSPFKGEKRKEKCDVRLFFMASTCKVFKLRTSTSNTSVCCFVCVETSTLVVRQFPYFYCRVEEQYCNSTLLRLMREIKYSTSTERNGKCTHFRLQKDIYSRIIYIYTYIYIMLLFIIYSLKYFKWHYAYICVRVR